MMAERPPDVNESVARSVTWGVWLVVGVAVAVLAVVALGRENFNYNTETDYLGSFRPEAERLLRGEPLEIAFHPPLYPMSLALVHTVVADWFTTGLLVSLVAALATLGFAFSYFRRSLGIGAAVGGVLALLLSPIFLHFSLQATSDVFALALYVGAFLAVQVSVERRTLPYFLLAGAVIGLGLIARTNNVVLLGLLLFYLVPRQASAAVDAAPPGTVTGEARWRSLGTAALGITLPVLVWVAFATITGSPAFPTKNHENLALTYFSVGDRLSGDARRPLGERFTSTRQVLLEDPRHIARTFVADFQRTSLRLLARDTVLPVPFMALALVAVLVLLVREHDRRIAIAVVLLNLAAMYLLLNLKYYEHRYYLYLVPFIGAAIGHAFWLLVSRSSKPVLRGAAMAAFVTLLGYGVVNVVSETRRLQALDWSDDAVAAARLLRESGPTASSTLFARKSHIGYYAGLGVEMIPQVDTVDELVETLTAAGTDPAAQVYLFYGVVEQRTRPQFAALRDPSAAETLGLSLIASGPERDGWYLYSTAAGPSSALGAESVSR
jgi:hypothetical protein